MESVGIQPGSRRARAKRAKARKSRRRVLVGGALIAMLIIASAFLVGSGAIFTSTSANPGNVFTAGILTHSNSNAGGAILTAGPMKPGDTETGTVTIENTGDLSGNFSLAMVQTGGAAGTYGGYLYDVLDLTIEDTSTLVTVYSGKMNGFPMFVALGTWAPNASHEYLFTVHFPDGGVPASGNSGDNLYQASSATVEFIWNAVQQ